MVLELWRNDIDINAILLTIQYIHIVKENVSNLKI